MPEIPTQNPRSASRVVRTLHQALLAVVVGFAPLVALLDLPAETVGKISVGAVALVTAVARFYNVAWPAEEDLPEQF